MFFFKIDKYKQWLLFFIIIFLFTLSMIVWTVYSAIKTPVYYDKSLFNNSKTMNNNFNKLYSFNEAFNKKYDSDIKINSFNIELNFNEIYLSRRSLKKKGKYKNIIKLGKNRINIILKDKKNNEIIKNAKIHLFISKAIKEDKDIILKDFNFNNKSYNSILNIPDLGNWNIMGKITIKKDKGYFYLKTSNLKEIK